jgi:glucokinase
MRGRLAGSIGKGLGLVGDSTTVPVLEIGGTHLTTALVDRSGWNVVPGSLTRSPVHAKAATSALLDEFAAAASALGAEAGATWAVAIPGPFDYVAGVGRYEHVDKFESLTGQDVRAGLLSRIEPAPGALQFINDADAYGLGEAIAGAARDFSRSVCLTLGTGVGSAFVVDGVPVQEGPGVPPQASAHLLSFDGKPLEETMSRRALRAAWARSVGQSEPTLDVHEIAELSRSGDEVARGVLEAALGGFGRAMAPTIREFGAQVLVLGGSITGSWDIVEPLVREGLVAVEPSLSALPLRRAEHPEDAPLVGAASWAVRAGASVLRAS